MTIRRYVLSCVLALLPVTAFAQTPTVSWSQGNVVSAAQAQSFTPRLYVTPSGSSTQNAPVVVTTVTCTGASAPFACSAPLPAAASAATVTGAKTTITVQDTANGTPESPQSAPFTAGASVPTALRIQ